MEAVGGASAGGRVGLCFSFPSTLSTYQKFSGLKPLNHGVGDVTSVSYLSPDAEDRILRRLKIIPDEASCIHNALVLQYW